MSSFVYSKEQARTYISRATEKFAVGLWNFMEITGRHMAAILESKAGNGKIVICCGKGNNAGSGLAMARYLINWGHDVEVWMLNEPKKLSKYARFNFEILRDSCGKFFFTGHEPESFDAALYYSDWVVDAVLGVGIDGAPRKEEAKVIRKINSIAKKVFAVDVPSGLNVDTGTPYTPTIRAAYTCTLMALKKGFLNPESADWTGEVSVVDAGLPGCF
ncbi:MAG: NAD(P)H-hydrate epimerase [Planctomycetaceae bacterium]|jgi:NAD(P)H-hydrate epimerase|nr:NAD(P)H-hydrate epimerase [Planctomycetaceae bacterium]